MDACFAFLVARVSPKKSRRRPNVSRPRCEMRTKAKGEKGEKRQLAKSIVLLRLSEIHAD